MTTVYGLQVIYPDGETVILFETEKDRELCFNSFQSVNKNGVTEIIKIECFLLNHEDTVKQLFEGFKKL